MAVPVGSWVCRQCEEGVWSSIKSGWMSLRQDASQMRLSMTNTWDPFLMKKPLTENRHSGCAGFERLNDDEGLGGVVGESGFCKIGSEGIDGGEVQFTMVFAKLVFGYPLAGYISDLVFTSFID